MNRFLAAIASLAFAGTSFGAFTGQPILGTLGPGGVGNGDTTGHADDNDGFTSGDHIFDIWPGPDDVWRINWPGGDLNVRLDYSPAADDLDLFVFRPTSLDDSGDYSIINTGIEEVSIPAADPGMYFVNIDSDTAAHAGPYTLSVGAIPEPATLGLAAFGLILLRRRA